MFSPYFGLLQANVSPLCDDAHGLVLTLVIPVVFQERALGRRRRREGRGPPGGDRAHAAEVSQPVSEVRVGAGGERHLPVQRDRRDVATIRNYLLRNQRKAKQTRTDSDDIIAANV